MVFVIELVSCFRSEFVIRNLWPVLTNQEQSEIIADKFASIQNEYEALQTDDIIVPPFTQKQIPTIQPSQVWVREEQELLEILYLKLFGVKTLVSILIEPSLATVVLLGIKKKNENLA